MPQMMKASYQHPQASSCMQYGCTQDIAASAPRRTCTLRLSDLCASSRVNTNLLSFALADGDLCTAPHPTSPHAQ